MVEKAMADEIEKSLVKAAAGMNIRGDDDNYSSDDEKYRVPGYKSAPEEEPDDKKPDWMHHYEAGVKDTVKSMSREELEAGFVKTKIELQLTKKAKTEQSVAAGSGTKIKRDNAVLHDAIVKDETVGDVIGKMEELQINNPLALWWVTQWGEEFMQRFKKENPGVNDPTYAKWVDDTAAFDSYTRWTQGSKKRDPSKKTAGMRHWSSKGDSQPASGSVTPASAKKSAGSPFF